MMPGVAVVLGSSRREKDGSYLSRADRAAVHLAVTKFGRPVTALVAEPDDIAERYAIAAGVHTVDRISIDSPPQFDLVLVGQGMIERHGDLFPARLALSHGAALLFDVIDVQPMRDDRFRVVRDIGKGAREVISVLSPAVIVMSADVPKTPYVSQYRLNRVRPAPKEPAFSDVVAAIDSWEPARPRVRTLRKAGTGDSSADRMAGAFGAMTTNEADAEMLIEDDPQVCAQHLVRYLRHHGFISAGGSEEDVPLQPTTRAPSERQKPAASSAPTRLNSASQPLGRCPVPLNGDVSDRVRRRPRPISLSSNQSKTLIRAPQKIDVDGRPMEKQKDALRRRPAKVMEPTRQQSSHQ